MRKSQIVVVILAILMFVGIVAVAYRRKQQLSGPPIVVGTPVNHIKEVDSFNAPKDFPPNFPMKEGSKITDNFSSTSADGRVQSTRIIRSPLSVMDAFSYYKSFLQRESAAWKIVGEINSATNPTHKAIFAQNSRGSLSINISADPMPGFSVVDASYLIQKTK